MEKSILGKRNVKSAILFVADTVMLAMSFVLSCYLSGYAVSKIDDALFMVMPITLLAQTIVFLRLGLYRAMLRYASIDFIIVILKAVTALTMCIVLGLYLVHEHLPAKLMFLNWVLTICFIGGSRFVARYYFFELRQRKHLGRRVLIYGAGDMGSLALRQLLLNKTVLYSPVGFIDDDSKKQGAVIRGIKILGTVAKLEEILEQFAVEEVVVAIAEIDSDNLREVVKRCRGKTIICRIIPCFSRLVEMEPNIRNIELADLMRRPARDLNKNAIRDYLNQKTVLITGAAGSIGSEIVRQCLEYDPKVVIALDQSELGLYKLEEELGPKGIKYILCDATRYDNLESVFLQHSPDIVFHAAAYKHVPLLEANPAEAVRNNVTSTKNLCELSDQNNVKSFVMISTDKAVRPSSIMGTTKRICELIVQNFDKRSKTEFLAVRFGNVLGSSGSVVPKFVEQIRNGGPITVTHPAATRYFMLIDEAVQLVLQAATIGKGGEIFILDMGQPVRIADMAEDLVYLMGRQPHEEIKIEFSGLRPGEKIHEELFNDEIENPTKFKEITIGKAKIVEWEWLEKNVNQLLEYAENNLVSDMLNTMVDLVQDGSFQNNEKPIIRWSFDEVKELQNAQ